MIRSITRETAAKRLSIHERQLDIILDAVEQVFNNIVEDVLDLCPNKRCSNSSMIEIVNDCSRIEQQLKEGKHPDLAEKFRDADTDLRYSVCRIVLRDKVYCY